MLWFLTVCLPPAAVFLLLFLLRCGTPAVAPCCRSFRLTSRCWTSAPCLWTASTSWPLWQRRCWSSTGGNEPGGLRVFCETLHAAKRRLRWRGVYGGVKLQDDHPCSSVWAATSKRAVSPATCSLKGQFYKSWFCFLQLWKHHTETWWWNCWVICSSMHDSATVRLWDVLEMWWRIITRKSIVTPVVRGLTFNFLNLVRSLKWFLIQNHLFLVFNLIFCPHPDGRQISWWKCNVF